MVDEDDDGDDLDVLVLDCKAIDFDDDCRWEWLTRIWAHSMYSTSAIFYPSSTNELDVNHLVVELSNLGALDDSKEDLVGIECFDLQFLLSSLMIFALTAHSFLTSLPLTILMLTVPIFYLSLMSLNSMCATESLKLIFASWIFAILFLTLLTSLLMIMNLAMFRIGMMLLNSSS